MKSDQPTDRELLNEALSVIREWAYYDEDSLALKYKIQHRLSQPEDVPVERVRELVEKWRHFHPRSPYAEELAALYEKGEG